MAYNIKLNSRAGWCFKGRVRRVEAAETPASEIMAGIVLALTCLAVVADVSLMSLI